MTQRNRIFVPTKRFKDVRDGLVLDLNMGENVAGDVIDHSGKGNDGEITGASRVTDDETLKKVLSFDGVDDYVDIESNSYMNPESAVTILTMAYINNADNYYRFFYRGGMILNLESNDAGSKKIRWMFRDEDSVNHTVKTNAGIPIQKWFQVVATYDGSIQNLFIDGDKQEEENSFSKNIKQELSSVEIGRAGIFYLDGLIAISRVYDKALSADEVKRLTRFLRHKMGLPQS